MRLALFFAATGEAVPCAAFLQGADLQLGLCEGPTYSGGNLVGTAQTEQDAYSRPRRSQFHLRPRRIPEPRLPRGRKSHHAACHPGSRNEPDAAPAQFIDVTQRLDADLGWNTFQLGHFGFGGVTYQMPAGRARHLLHRRPRRWRRLRGCECKLRSNKPASSPGPSPPSIRPPRSTSRSATCWKASPPDVNRPQRLGLGQLCH